MAYSFESILPPKGVSKDDWVNHGWQFKNSLKRKEDFESYFSLSSDERLGFDLKQFQIRVTPYYVQLAAGESERGPIRQILMPSAQEANEGIQQMLDPLGERKKENHSAARIIHRYPDRCLFLVTDFCSVYCRYCTRKHFTGKEQFLPKESEYQESLNYIRKTPKIKEVILSGGDPLTLSNEKLDKILFDLRSIDHVELIRIGSRIPVVNPMRVDQGLVELFRKHKPVYLMTHFNHPKELTAESAKALELVVDHGTPVFNQLVLLNGINNHPAIIYALSRRLLYLRVKPYYMFQCDPSMGTDHLRTNYQQSRQILDDLWGKASGLATPGLSLDIPDGGGKAGYSPNFVQSEIADTISFKGWDGVEAQYVSPPMETMQRPQDLESYIDEWRLIDS